MSAKSKKDSGQPKLPIKGMQPAAPEEQRLLRSLDEAVRDIDADKGAPKNDVRKRMPHGHNFLACIRRFLRINLLPVCAMALNLPAK